ncbi:cuticle protein AM1159-like [Penaeus monodon]|uniref:cuticle protein AM1159-like n=1 Tax=Penaeus monodon TaxID=6687 RepID=UPI0018A772F8|nr:cuticle protein AM1159-like [Penaeus monodon]
MKLIVFACLAALALARPQTPESQAETVLDERSDNGDGNFQYTFETSNGIRANKIGSPGSKGQSNMQGSFSFLLPDGSDKPKLLKLIFGVTLAYLGKSHFQEQRKYSVEMGSVRQ